MNSRKFNDWLQILASVGVILSLLFVGLQIQQSREIAIADIYQQRTALLMQQTGFSTPPEEVLQALNKEWAGESLDRSDEWVLYMMSASRLAYWENNHFQYQVGLLSEEQWEASRNAIRSVSTDPQFLKAWELEHDIVRRSFAEAVDEILREESDK
jgi:hypothetical protein